MSDAKRRALRTLVQAVAGLLAAFGVDAAANLSPVFTSALAAALTAVASVAQNALEDSGKVPVLLK